MKKLVFVTVTVVIALVAPAAFASSITAINLTCSGSSAAGPGNTGKKAASPGSGCGTATGYEGLSGSVAANWQGGDSSRWYQSSVSGANYYILNATGSPYVNPGNQKNGEFATGETSSPFNYVSNGGFNWTSGTGNNANSTTPGTPALESGGTHGDPHQLKITDSNGSTFTFGGFYFGETTTATLDYMIFGYDGSKLEYCITSLGTACPNTNLNSDWATLMPTYSGSGVYYTLISNPDVAVPVTTVYIDTATPGNYQYLDDFLVSETPEPRSLTLLGAGFALLGLGLLLRRRLAGSGTAINDSSAA